MFQIILNNGQKKNEMKKKKRFKGINFLVFNVETAYKRNVEKALTCAV